MSIITRTAPPVGGRSPDVPSGLLWRLSVDQYHRMIREGILTEDDRVELLEGLLVAKMTKNPPHIVATDLLQAALPRIVPAGWFVSMQNPVTMEDSEPEPDARVVRGQPRDYVGRRAGPGDVALVVEVADTSLPSDRGIKKRIYARAGIAYYWIINLSDGRLEVYDDPTGPAEEPDYRGRRDFGPLDTVPLMIEGREVGRLDVRELLP